MTVFVQSPTTVLVDGENFGSVADCIANNRALAPAIQRSLAELFDSLNKSHTDAVAEMNTAHEAELVSVRSNHTTELRACEEAINNLGNSFAAERQALIEERDSALRDIADNEALQAQLVGAAKAAFDAKDLDAVGRVVQAALQSPSIVRAREAALSDKQAAESLLAQAEARLQAL